MRAKIKSSQVFEVTIGSNSYEMRKEGEWEGMIKYTCDKGSVIVSVNPNDRIWSLFGFFENKELDMDIIAASPGLINPKDVEAYQKTLYGVLHKKYAFEVAQEEIKAEENLSLESCKKVSQDMCQELFHQAVCPQYEKLGNVGDLASFNDCFVCDDRLKCPNSLAQPPHTGRLD